MFLFRPKYLPQLSTFLAVIVGVFSMPHFLGADTKSHFGTLKRTLYLILIALDRTNEKKM